MNFAGLWATFEDGSVVVLGVGLVGLFAVFLVLFLVVAFGRLGIFVVVFSGSRTAPEARFVAFFFRRPSILEFGQARLYRVKFAGCNAVLLTSGKNQFDILLHF